MNDLLDPVSASPGGPEQEKALDLLNTHTHYYLAQVRNIITFEHNNINPPMFVLLWEWHPSVR